jgi:hypothetical protein
MDLVVAGDLDALAPTEAFERTHVHHVDPNELSREEHAEFDRLFDVVARYATSEELRTSDYPYKSGDDVLSAVRAANGVLRRNRS